MWDEEINKKIKDAADQYHPAYDDNAWDKMEQMLDEHLPRKKDRRRIIYLLPLILFLGGGIFFVISRKEPVHPLQISEKSQLKKSSIRQTIEIVLLLRGVSTTGATQGTSCEQKKNLLPEKRYIPGTAA